MNYIQYEHVVVICSALNYLKHQLTTFREDEDVKKKYPESVLNSSINNEIELIDEIIKVFDESIKNQANFTYFEKFSDSFSLNSITVMIYALKCYTNNLSNLKTELETIFSNSPLKFEWITEEISEVKKILELPCFQ